MATAAAYIQIRPMRRYSGSSANLGSAVNTGFQGSFRCDLHRSLRIKDGRGIDPCCGGGYLLAVLGFFHNGVIKKLYGSDADENMVKMAEKNASLLTVRGLDKRKKELENLYGEFRKASHKGAMESCDRLRDILKKEIDAEIFQADCTESLPRILPDIIIVDIPYGNLTEWNEPLDWNLEKMMDRLWEISQEETVLAICMDKRQKCHSEKWARLEKTNIGKRRFEIYRKTRK